MSYLDKIADCNGWNPQDYRRFMIEGIPVGWVSPDFGRRLGDWPRVFHWDGAVLSLHEGLNGLQQRSAAVAGVLQALVDASELDPFHGELYPVGVERTRPMMLIDRAMASHFGVHAHGQHINGMVRRGDDISLWIARRARDKRTFPGMLDHLAAGGLPHGLSLRENLLKECWEEAAIPAELAAKARPVGTVSYCKSTSLGLKPDTIYCYDLELPEDFQPRANDGEVESFRLVPLQEVAEWVRDTREFKPNCALVIMDLMIRHGRLDPETEGYPQLVQGLHPSLP